jgi:hypothetical protein
MSLAATARSLHICNRCDTLFALTSDTSSAVNYRHTLKIDRTFSSRCSFVQTSYPDVRRDGPRVRRRARAGAPSHTTRTPLPFHVGLFTGSRSAFFVPYDRLSSKSTVKEHTDFMSRDRTTLPSHIKGMKRGLFKNDISRS